MTSTEAVRHWRERNPEAHKAAIARENASAAGKARKARWAASHRAQIASHNREIGVAFRAAMNIIKARGCTDCGTTEGKLHFHHVDPSTKLFSIALGAGRSLATLLAELDKCVVLCEPCHLERHRKARLVA